MSLARLTALGGGVTVTPKVDSPGGGAVAYDAIAPQNMSP